MKAKTVVSPKGGEAVRADNFPAAIERAHNLRTPSAHHAKAGPREEARPPYWTWFIANPRGRVET